MRKTITKETIREYDKDGKLVNETVTETTETDDTPYVPQIVTPCYQNTWFTTPTPSTMPAPVYKPQITCCASDKG